MPTIPEPVGQLVDRMLARDRDARPGDLRDVYSELARHTAHVAPSFGPPAPSRFSPLSESQGESDAVLAVAPTELHSAPPRPGRENS